MDSKQVPAVAKPRPGSFLSVGECSPKDLCELLDRSLHLARVRRAGGCFYPKAMGGGRLAGRTLAAIFEKPSTRTRAAFCAASHEEGALAQCLTRDDIHLGDKEAVCDTARVLSQFFSVIAWRGHDHGLLQSLAHEASVPVVNLLSDTHHPTQALADALTMIEEFGSLEGRKVVFLGDVTNNVARSLCEMAQALSFSVTLSGPEELLHRPETPRQKSIVHDADPRRAVTGADVVYTDVWTSMGFCGPGSGDQKIDLFSYQVNSELMAATKNPRSIFLHCLPALREQEVTSQVLDSSQSRVLVQAENRLHTMKAVLLRACGWPVG